MFIQSHNGMEVYNDSRDFVSSQLASTRNVHSNLFNDWCAPSPVVCIVFQACHDICLLRYRFTGGLNRQIEHHLFPTLPRHNLAKAQKLTRALCSNHGIYYEVRPTCAAGRCCAPRVT